MFNSLLEWFINLIANTFIQFINIFTSQITGIIEIFMPNFTDILTIATSFLNDYFFPGFQFVKMALINLLHISPTIMQAILYCGFITISVFLSTRVIRFGFNVWGAIQGKF